MTALGDQVSGVVRVDGDRAVAFVAGEIDVATAADFRAVLDQAIATGVPTVVVDMADVKFFGATGLTVLVRVARHLRRTGRRLAVRAVPPTSYRVFEITGLTESLGVERPAGSLTLVRALAAGAAVPHVHDVLDAALQLVVMMAQAVVAGADGVSITLPRHGQLGTVAASNDVVLEMDHDQYDTSEGPCLDAATQGLRFQIDSLQTEQRWPAFVPRARARGIESILSTPLGSVAAPIGALNVYSRAAGAFAVHELRWADQFAAQASTVVSAAQRGDSVVLLDSRIQDALLSREVVAIAQGMIMQRDGYSRAAASAALRAVSRSTGRPLRDICEELVSASGGTEEIRGLSEGSSHGRPSQ